MKVGVIGVGQMGWHMANRLARAGHDVIAHDPRPEIGSRLREIGVRSAASACEVSRQAEATILMVLNSKQAEEAIWGEDGFAAGARPDSLLVIMSSLPPRFLGELDARSDGEFVIVDAPVSGGVEGASAGTLTIMAAGRGADIDRAVPVLSELGEVVRVGSQPGLGATMKTVNQAMYFAAFASAAEMLVSAVKAGLDPDTVVEVVGRSSGASWALQNRVPLAWRESYVSGGALAIAAKDLAAALDLAQDLDVDASVTRAAAALVDEAMARHAGGGDDPLIVEAVEAQAGFFIGGRLSD